MHIRNIHYNFLLLIVFLVFLVVVGIWGLRHKFNCDSGTMFQEMTSFHYRMDPLLPPDLVYFIGDSHVQGLATQAIYSKSVNFGIGSDTTSGVLHRIVRYNSLKSAKAILLAIGFNDLKTETPRYTAENLTRIIQKIPDHIPIFMNEIFPIDVEKFNLQLAQRISELNDRISNICKDFDNVHCIKVYGSFMSDNNSLNKAFDIGDGLHLSRSGYERWIKEIQKSMKKEEIINE